MKYTNQWKAVTVKWLVDWERSFKPRKSSGRSEEGNWSEAIEEIEKFMARI